MLAGHASECWLSELGAGMPYNREKRNLKIEENSEKQEKIRIARNLQNVSFWPQKLPKRSGEPISIF